MVRSVSPLVRRQAHLDALHLARSCDQNGAVAVASYMAGIAGDFALRAVLSFLESAGP